MNLDNIRNELACSDNRCFQYEKILSALKAFKRNQSSKLKLALELMKARDWLIKINNKETGDFNRMCHLEHSVDVIDFCYELICDYLDKYFFTRTNLNGLLHSVRRAYREEDEYRAVANEYLKYGLRKETIDSIEEAEEIKAHPDEYPAFNSVQEMFDHLMKEAADELKEEAMEEINETGF